MGTLKRIVPFFQRGNSVGSQSADKCEYSVQVRLGVAKTPAQNQDGLFNLGVNLGAGRGLLLRLLVQGVDFVVCLSAEKLAQWFDGFS